DVPERVPLAPSETIPVPRLDRLLAFPTIDEFIAEQLLPRFDDGAIFTPQRFRALLEMAPEALRAAAEHQPAAARPLGKAARLLVESVSMHDLLHMYRSALFQG
ncbi:MAG TPA: hypothetical protein VK832_14135, partial [Burkholderiaceae bacterium]|nr:hypothetical protein [Burkholderiaceae bacterium]